LKKTDGDFARKIFLEGAHLQRRFARLHPSDWVPMFLRHFLEIRDYDAIELLRSEAERRIGTAAAMCFEIARNMPATQSTVCEWSRGLTAATDAVGALSGQLTGHFGFHTDYEEDPWWCVDLQLVCPVRAIQIYNRREHALRAKSITVFGSTDLVSWTSFYEQSDPSIFGEDGKPLRIEFGRPTLTRFVRIQLREKQSLHLDQVEIYV